MSNTLVDRVRETRIFRRRSPHLRQITPVEDLPPLEVKEPDLFDRFDEAWNIVIAKHGAAHRDSCQRFVCRTVDQPGCVVGTVLHTLGVSLEYLDNHAGVDQVVGEKFGEYPKHDRDRVVTALANAMQHNDAGSTWGECRAAYDANLRRF